LGKANGDMLEREHQTHALKLKIENHIRGVGRSTVKLKMVWKKS
jgi:hypothetical protein